MSYEKFNKKTNKEFPYVVEIVDSQTYNLETGVEEETPVYVSIEHRRFKHWEEAVDFFYKIRITRDFCYGDNFKEYEDKILRWETDEGGLTEYYLYKWEGFDQCRKVEYMFTHDDETETIYSLSDLDKRVKELYGDDAYVYWHDDTGGYFGGVHSPTRNGYSEDAKIYNHTDWITTDYWEEKRKLSEKREKERIEWDKKVEMFAREAESPDGKVSDEAKDFPF